ncbi:unnamed protein product [Closterium sp. NIES-64]|nr:unnamed protein product [Closterium sp. NIES-64]
MIGGAPVASGDAANNLLEATFGDEADDGLPPERYDFDRAQASSTDVFTTWGIQPAIGFSDPLCATHTANPAAIGGDSAGEQQRGIPGVGVAVGGIYATSIVSASEDAVATGDAAAMGDPAAIAEANELPSGGATAPSELPLDLLEARQLLELFRVMKVEQEAQFEGLSLARYGFYEENDRTQASCADVLTALGIQPASGSSDPLCANHTANPAAVCGEFAQKTGTPRLGVESASAGDATAEQQHESQDAGVGAAVGAGDGGTGLTITGVLQRRKRHRRQAGASGSNDGVRAASNANMQRSLALVNMHSRGDTASDASGSSDVARAASTTSMQRDLALSPLQSRCNSQSIRSSRKVRAPLFNLDSSQNISNNLLAD